MLRHALASSGPLTHAIAESQQLSRTPRPRTGTRWLIAVGWGPGRGRIDRRASVGELIAQLIKNERLFKRAATRSGAVRPGYRPVAATGRYALIEVQTIIGVLRTSEETLYAALDNSDYSVPSPEELVEVLRTAHLPGRVGLRRHRDSAIAELAHSHIPRETLTNVLRYANDATRVGVRLAVTAVAGSVGTVGTDSSAGRFGRGAPQKTARMARRCGNPTAARRRRLTCASDVCNRGLGSPRVHAWAYLLSIWFFGDM